jgi:hypothetical protein
MTKIVMYPFIRLASLSKLWKYVMWAFLVVISFLVFAGSLVGLLFKGTRGKAKKDHARQGV